MKRDKKNRTASKKPIADQRKADAIKQIADAHLEQAVGGMHRACCSSRCL